MEITELVAHAAFRLVDDFTGQSPTGKLRYFLDREISANSWAPSDIEPVNSGSGVLFYPYLEKKRDVNSPPRRYRFRVESPLYHPAYQADSDGFEFDAFPYSDEAVINPFAAVVQTVALRPSPAYSFAPDLPVLRGTIVRQADGKTVKYAEITKANQETALSDERGEFALPLRWIQTSPFDIDVVDKRTNESRTKAIVVPGMLGMNVVIDIL